jgi:hypothetical protein
VSTVRIGTTFKVTHHYHPSPATPNLYESVVTIRNISTATVEPRYRRVMGWDVEPTYFSEFVTANIGTTTALLANNNDGFSTSNPLGPRTSGSIIDVPVVTGNFTDIGPGDHGALFDFGFDPLASGESVTFKIFYGAAANEAAALSALDAGGAEVYSLAQPNTTNGPTLGTPNTFIFGFAEAYDFQGFFRPVDNLPTLNIVNAGRAVPVKFSLGGDEGLDIFAEGYPKSRQIECSSSAPLDSIEQTLSAGASNLSYDATTERYIYAWKTKKAWEGTCRQLVVKLDDGSVHKANFKFR